MSFLTDDQKALIRRTFGVDNDGHQIDKDAVETLIVTAERTQLDPFARHLYLIKRAGKWRVEVSIDGARMAAERTERYRGRKGPFWCGKDGSWKDVWLESFPPAAAKVEILKEGCDAPFVGVARYQSYAQESSPTWKKLPDQMLVKCAEMQGLRAAFPILGGLYTAEEMTQADIEPVSTQIDPASIARNQACQAQERVEPRARVAEQPVVATVDESKPVNAPAPPHDPVTGEVLQYVSPDAPELAQLKAQIKSLGHAKVSSAMSFLSELAQRPVSRMGELTLVDCQAGLKLLTTYHERLAALNYGDQDAAGRDQFLSSLLGRPMTSPLTCAEVGHVIAKIDEILQPAVTAAAAVAAPQASDDDF